MQDELQARVARLERQIELIEAHYGEGLWRALDQSYAANLPSRRIRCIVCDRTDVRSAFETVIAECIFRGGRLERYRCPSCDCIFGPLKYLDLPDEFVRRDYELLYTRYAEGDSTENEMRTFRSLAPKEGGRYLDWGCGGGWSRTIQELRNEGWTVVGYEPSATAPGEHVFNNREKVVAPFDGIFSNNVIEHFREPIAQFREFHHLLTDGGLMVHSSPCYEYLYEFTRFHSVFLLGRSPDVLAERTGFQVVDRVRDGEYISVSFRKI